MGYPSPAVDVRTGAGDPVLNADVVLANAAAVVVATAAACVVDYCNDNVMVGRGFSVKTHLRCCRCGRGRRRRYGYR